MTQIREVFQYYDGRKDEPLYRDVESWVADRLSKGDEGIERHARRLASCLAFLAGKMVAAKLITGAELIAELGTDGYRTAEAVEVDES